MNLQPAQFSFILVVIHSLISQNGPVEHEFQSVVTCSNKVHDEPTFDFHPTRVFRSVSQAFSLVLYVSLSSVAAFYSAALGQLLEEICSRLICRA